MWPTISAVYAESAITRGLCASLVHATAFGGCTQRRSHPGSGQKPPGCVCDFRTTFPAVTVLLRQQRTLLSLSFASTTNSCCLLWNKSSAKTPFMVKWNHAGITVISVACHDQRKEPNKSDLYLHSLRFRSDVLSSASSGFVHMRQLPWQPRL